MVQGRCQVLIFDEFGESNACARAPRRRGRAIRDVHITVARSPLCGAKEYEATGLRARGAGGFRCADTRRRRPAGAELTSRASGGWSR